MNVTTKSRFWQILVWLSWLLVLLAGWGRADLPGADPDSRGAAGALALPAPLAGLTADPPGRGLFPWGPRGRWRKWAFQRYQDLRRRYYQARGAYYRAVGVAHAARLMLTGVVTFATLVDWLTRAQLRRQVGALPVLYAVLEILHVREIINQYCPAGAAEVDHGTVALVLLLNRLTAPRPLSGIAAWLGETCLPAKLGVPAAKFNDDRLRRTLDALYPHLRAIWQDLIDHALGHFDIDLRVIFYDLTAFVLHGAYAQSQLVGFGFAHNTPMNKRKFKAAFDTAADGNIPVDYDPWAGPTADTATVQANLERLRQLWAARGYAPEGVLVIGDRANLNAELALAYDRQQKTSGLSYLCGLEARQKEHRRLLEAYPDEYFLRRPLGQAGYYGVPGAVSFKFAGQRVTHRGVVVLSQPMQRAKRAGRTLQFQTLDQALAGVVAKIGQRGYRTAAQVQKHAQVCLRRSPVGRLVQAWAVVTDEVIQLRWQVDQRALAACERHDGRYLLVTNHPTLTPREMLALYRAKDGGEKNFTVCKKDLRVSPVYLHTDARIAAMLLLHMLALLTYNILQRQARQHGLVLTTRRLIAALTNLTVIETHCWDGSVLVRLTPVSTEQAQLLEALAVVLAAMWWPRQRLVLPVPAAGGPDPGLAPGPPPWEDVPLLRPAA